MGSQTQILWVMIIYMVLLILWGFYQGRKVKTASDFAIAGRKLPGWVAALSERSTGESSWALLGLPGAAYAIGLLEVWTAIGCFLGVVASWAILAWRLRDEAEKYDVTSFTDYLAKRHGEAALGIRVVGTITIVFFFFFYVGAQFIGGGKTLENIFGIPTEYGMVIIVVMVIPYTIYGGFRSVTYTDVIQAIIMIIALVVTPIAGMIYIANQPEGSIYAHSIADALNGAGERYSTLTGGAILQEDSALSVKLASWFPNAGNIAKGIGTGVIITGMFSWFFGFLGGQPQLSMRFMAITNRKQAKVARNISIVWTLFAYTGALLIGYIGIAIFGPAGLADRETVMPEVLTTLFPPVIAGILITGILAAIISTANSLLILSSTELSESLLKPLGYKGKSEKGSLSISRWITAILSVVALGVAYVTPSKYVDSIVSYVWSGIGSTFSVVILLTLFWKRFHGIPAVLTILSGLIFTITWHSLGLEEIVSTRLLTFVVSFMVAASTSYLIRKKNIK